MSLELQQELKKELKLVCQIIYAITNPFFQKNLRTTQLKPQAEFLFREAVKIFPPLEKDQLRPKMTHINDSFDLDNDFSKYIYLEPFESGTWILPILSLAFDCASTLSISFKLILIVPHEDEGRIKAIGYRFENGVNTHDYYHVQHITRIGKNRLKLPTAAWIPEKSPTIPLEAGGPISLLLCMLGSIYGIDLKEKLIGLGSQAGIDISQIKNFVHRKSSPPLFLNQVC